MSKLVSLSLLGVLAVASSVGLAAPASAASPSLTCKIFPSHFPYRTGACGTTLAAGSYLVDFLVKNGPAGGYVWQYPSDLQVVDGCLPTTPYCSVTLLTGSFDRDIDTTVSGPNFGPLTVTAAIPAVCGNFLC